MNSSPIDEASWSIISGESIKPLKVTESQTARGRNYEYGMNPVPGNNQ
jgi:hypothetical protein